MNLDSKSSEESAFGCKCLESNCFPFNPATFFLSVSICEASLFLIDIYNESLWHPSFLQCLLLDSHLGWALVFVFLFLDPTQLSEQKLQVARVRPCSQGESQLLCLLPSPLSCFHLTFGLCGCLSLLPVQ